MKKIEGYIDDAIVLTRTLSFAIPALLTTSPTAKTVEDGLKAFDQQVKNIRDQVTLSLLDSPEALESVAKINQHWKQSIVDSIYELKHSEFVHLLSEPNVFFSLYLQQDEFPEDGMERLMKFFIEGFNEEVIALNIPLKELLKDKNELIESLDRLAEQEVADIGRAQGYVDCVLYLHGFYAKDILLYLERLDTSADPAKYAFGQACRNAIVKARGMQRTLSF